VLSCCKGRCDSPRMAVRTSLTRIQTRMTSLERCFTNRENLDGQGYAVQVRPQTFSLTEPSTSERGAGVHVDSRGKKGGHDTATTPSRIGTPPSPSGKWRQSAPIASIPAGTGLSASRACDLSRTAWRCGCTPTQLLLMRTVFASRREESGRVDRWKYVEASLS
jgi:hypothetical protein